MRVPIEVFDHLNKIAKRRKISQTAWAKACGIEQPRIAEHVSTSKEKRGIKEKTENYSGTVTLQSMFILVQGLKQILGRDSMTEEVKIELNAESDPYIRLQLITLSKYNEGDKDFIRKLEEYASMLFKTS
jgi:hypothetical protein